MKGKNKASAILAILALIIGMLAIQLPIPVYATGSVTVALPNVSWTYPDRDVGQILVMDLTITNDTASPLDNVTSWEADFSWDPSILECTGVIEGSFLSSAAGSGNTSFTAGTINNVAGTVTGANVTITTAAYATVDGTGILAILVFKVIDCGSTSVTVVSCDATGPQGTVTVTRVNGSFSMSVTVSLPSTTWTYPDRDVGQILVMDFAIETPAGWSGVSSWKANFSWNPSILECTAIIEGSFLSSAAGIGNTSFTAGTINNVAGTITGANGTITTVATATGSGTLAILVFKVIDCGSTPVTITDVEVLGSEIPATTVNGYFSMGVTVSLPSVTWTYPTQNINQTFTMNFAIETPAGWSGVSSWKANFSWNPSILECTAIIEGSFLEDAAGSGNTSFTAGTINNVAGTVTGANGTITTTATATGSGTLATLVFKVIDCGSTPVTITDVEVLGSEIPATTVDGYFEFGATLELDNIPWTYPDHNISDTFEMNLTIRSAVLFAWQAGLSFDPDVVNVVSVALGVGFYLNQTGPIQALYDSSYINNTAGTVDVFGCTLLGGASAPATGSGGATVATITFNVTGHGKTAILITDAKAFGSEIPVTTVDGYFEFGGTMDFVPSLAGPVTKGTTFSINLTIYTTELFAWQAGLSFDPNILEVISITGGEGYYLNQTGPVQWIYDSSYINNTAGTVDVFGCTLLGGASAPATGSGGATVATITFKVLSYISTSPYCTTIEITDAKAFGSEIPVTPEHGKFRLKIGDVNADVNVSGADIVLVLINLGAVPPKPTECDINNDNNVSGADIVLVLINLGGYPPCP